MHWYTPLQPTHKIPVYLLLLFHKSRSFVGEQSSNKIPDKPVLLVMNLSRNYSPSAEWQWERAVCLINFISFRVSMNLINTLLRFHILFITFCLYFLTPLKIIDEGLPCITKVTSIYRIGSFSLLWIETGVNSFRNKRKVSSIALH